ncbi:MAG: glycosyltransferase [Candidatus Omnitrophota bacterium]
MRVALVHDWLIHMRGGEKVLEALAEMYPDAKIYTLFCDRSKLSPGLQKMEMRTSFLQYLPGIKRYYRWLLPWLPSVISTLKLEPADLVISSSHCVAKGIYVPAGVPHLTYCHTPMRYLWGFEDEYFGAYPLWVKWLIRRILERLRAWDLETNSGILHFICNSENVLNRVRKYYGREGSVVYPPLDTEQFSPDLATGEMRGEYYLAVSAFVPYKRLDIVIEAFNQLDRQLLVVGSGPLERAYRKMRKSNKISFLGAVPSSELRRFYAGAKALIFPAEEDFGIVPLEAQACGTPVIAYGKGGALEGVKTGVFFDAQTPQAVIEAVYAFERMSFERMAVAQKVAGFSKEHFKKNMQQCLKDVLKD